MLAQRSVRKEPKPTSQSGCRAHFAENHDHMSFLSWITDWFLMLWSLLRQSQWRDGSHDPSTFGPWRVGNRFLWMKILKSCPMCLLERDVNKSAYHAFLDFSMCALGPFALFLRVQGPGNAHIFMEVGLASACFTAAVLLPWAD